MSALSSKPFRVMFMARFCYEITLDAEGERQAVDEAKRLWEYHGEAAFTAYDGDTDAWQAEEET